MTRAERSDPTPPPVGLGPFGPPVPTPVGLFMPSGPPAPMPFSREVAQQTTLSLLGSRENAALLLLQVPALVFRMLSTSGPSRDGNGSLPCRSSSSCT